MLYYIDSRNDLIKIYKSNNENVYNRLTFESFLDAKFYLLYIKDTIFENIDYHIIDYSIIREYKSIKKKLNELENKKLEIEETFKQYDEYKEGFFSSKEWQEREEVELRYKALIKKEILTKFKYKLKIANKASKLSKRQVLPGSTTVDNILHNPNKAPYYLRLKTLLDIRNEYYDELLKIQSEIPKLKEEYKVLISKYDKEQAHLYKERKFMIEYKFESEKLNNRLNCILMKVLLDTDDNKFFQRIDFNEFDYSLIKRDKKSNSYNIFVLYKDNMIEISNIYLFDGKYYMSDSAGSFYPNSLDWFVNIYIGDEEVQLDEDIAFDFVESKIKR